MRLILCLICLIIIVCPTWAINNDDYNEPIPYKMLELEANASGYEEGAGSTDLTIMMRANFELDRGSYRHWGLRADLTGSSNFGAYWSLGPSYKDYLGNQTFYRLSLGPAWLIGQKPQLSLDASLLVVHQLSEIKYLLTEIQAKSNGRDFWYLARMHWQVLKAVGLGLRSQTNSLLGVYVQLGHENLGFLWFGYGVKENEPNKTCPASGIKFVF